MISPFGRFMRDSKEPKTEAVQVLSALVHTAFIGHAAAWCDPAAEIEGMGPSAKIHSPLYLRAK